MELNSRFLDDMKNGDEFMFVMGPCVIESRDHVLQMAEDLKNLSEELDFDLVFKSSYDKANRTSIESFRGPGLEEGLKILEEAKQKTGLPVLTDIHNPNQAKPASEVVDILQIPAFLCRQTDLVVAAAETDSVVNVKKGQFLSPHDVQYIGKKIQSADNNKIVYTERGYSFGYDNLVSDMRAIPIIKETTDSPVIFDGTHSAQMPGPGKTTGGSRKYIPNTTKAAVAAGCDGLYMEVHDDVDNAKSDSATQYPLSDIKELIEQIIELRNLMRSFN